MKFRFQINEVLLQRAVTLIELCAVNSHIEIENVKLPADWWLHQHVM